MTIQSSYSVLLLARNENSVSVDRAALRQAGARHIRFFADEADALAFLRAEAATGYGCHGGRAATHVVVCHEELPGGDLPGFINTLRGQAEQACPVLVLLNSHNPELRARALNAGADAALSRPYALGALANTLLQLTTPQQDQTRQSGQEAESAPAMRFAFFPDRARRQNPVNQTNRTNQINPADTAQARQAEGNGQAVFAGSAAPAGLNIRAASSPGATSSAGHASPSALSSPAGSRTSGRGRAEKDAAFYLASAHERLREGSAEALDQAEADFMQAIGLDPLNVDACLGLAQTARQSKNQAALLKWLHRAGSIYTRKGDTERARAIFSRLPEGTRGRFRDSDPLMEAAVDLMESGNYDAAAGIFMDMQREGALVPLHLSISRACQFTDNPEHSLGMVCRALQRRGHETAARNIMNRLMPPAEAEREEETSGFWKRFPMLYTVLTVAGHTARSLREANA